MNRRKIVQQIGATLKNNCDICPVRYGESERELRAKGMYAKADRFCLKDCPVGQELQALGIALDEHLKAQRALRPRKWQPDLEEEVG